MGMVLTNGQENGKKKTIEWWKSESRKPIWEISGYAGTGKSTLVKYIIDELGILDFQVAYATYTGKAALVLTMKGCPATTIHQLIYKLESHNRKKKNENGEEILDEKGEPIYEEVLDFIRKDKDELSHLQLIVLDECSMIDKDMLEDLLYFEIPIIVLGDNFQLGPIYGDSVLLNHPDILLTEIMRQKENDPIVHLATRVRNRQNLDYGKYGKSYVIDKNNIKADLEYGLNAYSSVFSMADIILCRTNRIRAKFNKHIREIIYNRHGDLPLVGDKIICRRNDWNTHLDELPNICLVNGLIGTVYNTIDKKDIDYTNALLKFDFKPELDNKDYFADVLTMLSGFMPDLDNKEKELLNYKAYKYCKNKKITANLFEYAYAITVHLSQGSSWKKVFIYDEPYGTDYYNSLYTAITRAETQVIIAK